MFPTQIALRNVRPSPELSTRIRDLCEKLGHLNSRILTCRVGVQQLLVRTRRETTSAGYAVEVQVRVPGQEFNAGPEQNADLALALRKAFLVVRRRLREAQAIERAASTDPRTYSGYR